MGECIVEGLGGERREWTKIDEYTMTGTSNSSVFAYGNLSNFDTDRYDRYKAVMTGTITGSRDEVVYFGTLGVSTRISFTDDRTVDISLGTEQIIVGGRLIPAICTNASDVARGDWNYAQCLEGTYNFSIPAVNIKITVYAR